MDYSTHQVVTDDGARISIDWYREPGRRTALVICPGFFQSKDTLTFQRLACALVGLCDIVCLDFRGHGRSSGLYTFSAREEADLSAAVRWAYTRYPTIGLLGFSLGGAAAIQFASGHHQIRSLIAVSAPARFEEIEFEFWTSEAIRTGARGLEAGAGCRPGNPWRRKRPPIEAIADLAPIPVLFIHGTNDPIVGLRHSRQLFERAHEPKRLEIIDGGGHAEDLYRACPDRFLPVVVEWLMDTLFEAPGRARAWSDGYLAVRKGLSVYYQQHATDASRPALVIVHGGGEHAGRYADTVARFVQAGLAVYLFDLPGHGRSPGVRGHIRRFDDYLDCVAAIVERASQAHPGRQPVLLGHSLGGLIATCYAAKHQDLLRGLMLSSPLWGMALRIPLWKRWLAQTLAPIWPSCTLRRPSSGRFALSHDPEIERRYNHDPLVHRVASASLYVQVLARLRRLPELLAGLRLPVLVLQAGDDRIASAATTEELFARVGSSQKMLHIYPGYFHELFNEIGKEAVFQDILAWLRGLDRQARWSPEASEG
ncbi:MAG: alpha/beta fold hydrolase [Candidatus Omnitrophica bacterium]|nr:alpha/beta fold hydrolase [Candidatus Omnitrophota bacterium]